MKIIREIEGWMTLRNSLKGKVGFVPTMGALHSGHAELIKRSLQENDFCVVSIFVNPTQFNDSADFKNYPESYSSDIELCKELGVHAMFLPSYKELYIDNYRYRINEYDFSKELCGSHREDHFTGVLTVVMKLLNLVAPNRAYFGEKDYQQYLLVKDMCAAFFMDVSIIACPTVRDEDGLAKSSRNRLLDRKSRRVAAYIYEAIASPSTDKEVQIKLEKLGMEVDYVVTKNGRRFVAVTIESGDSRVRLIDNTSIHKTLKSA